MMDPHRLYGPENRFLASNLNDDCPKDADYWHSYNKNGAELEVAFLLGGIIRAIQPELVVETGTAWGDTAEQLGDAIALNGHGRLVTLEPNKRRQIYSYRRCRSLPVRCLRLRSLDWTPEKTEVINFLFIDSDYESRMLEFRHFKPYMNKYSFVAWHDTGTQHAGKEYPINQYIKKLRDQGEIAPISFPTPRGLCLARILK